MDHTHQFGKSINILRFSESKEVIVDNKELEKIFGHPEIQDRKVVILSLIGAFRGGKSFFLDYCLRFLYAHFPSINNRSKSSQSYFRKDDNWMGSPDEPLAGFSWRSGTKRETIGINIWSDVFLHTMDRTGEKIAILVMDTQGLFDNQSTPTDNSRIFALGTLISSIQVLNLKQQVQEDHLQYLQFANELAQFTLKKKMKMEGKPFQNMTFLIRDWENNEEFHYGFTGGHEYIKDVLIIKPDQSQELKAVRSSILDSFEQVNCCLLPHPGDVVAGQRNYDGRWSQMDRIFKAELKSSIEHLLYPDNLTVKKINSKDIIVHEMKQYIQVYMTLFQSNEIPKALSIYEYTVMSHMNNLIEKSVDDYKLTIYRNADLINDQNSQKIHDKCKERALQLYDTEDKMGTADHDEIFKVKLSEEIDKIYGYFKQQNEQIEKELTKEREKMQIALDREQQQHREAVEAKRQIEHQLEELKTLKSRIDAEEYERKTRMLEERVHAEQQRVQEYNNKLQAEQSFRNKLMSFLGISLIAITSIATGGIAAGAAAVSETVAAVGGAVATITAAANSCSIM
ncbi:atlastin-like [Chironomus tepperi]|uniref:atlastin-like n=1 Tax=Chironomus tepperi TaxID=113505 RepID=UPI00391F0539